jgi:hypothetical protein
MEVEMSVWLARCLPGLAGGPAGLARLRFLPSAAGFMGLMSVEFFTPSTNPRLLDVVLDKLITSYADTRLDAEPEVLIIDLNAN